MKNKLPLFALIGLLTASLSACDSFYNLFSSHGGRRSSKSSGDTSIVDVGDSSSSDSSSSNSSSSGNPIPLPEPGSLTAKQASYTYADYVENNYYDISSTPTEGDAKILIIPIWFEDSSSYIATKSRENVRQDIEKAYFGTNEETGWRSVKTYYEEESHGILTLTGTVSDWYEDDTSYTDYATEDSGHSNTVNLVKTATDWFFDNNPSEKRSDYDHNNDGYMDGVMLIYGAPDYGALGRSAQTHGNLWAYCYWLQQPNYRDILDPGPNAFFWASFDFMYGREVYAQRTGVTRRYTSGDTSRVSVDTHTFIHEMGHMFSLEDYYDYSQKYSPGGGFSMQDNNVGGHDPYSIFALGWGKAYIPTQSTTINLKPLTSSGEMIILSPSWNIENSPFDEYLIIEYYTSDGVNFMDANYEYHKGRGYPTTGNISGIRLWHVDARLLFTRNGSYRASNWTNNPSTREGYVTMMMSNTYSGYGSEGYITPLGEEYSNYNLLQMIRNSTLVSHKSTSNMSDADLFKAGDSFSMETFASQFVNKNELADGKALGLLNTGDELGFSFEVNGFTSEYASITINKL